MEEKDSEVLESAISQAKASEHTSTKGSSSRKSSGYYSMYSDPTRQELREEQSQVPYDDTAPSSPVAEEEEELECRSEEKVAGRVTFEGVTYYDGEYCIVNLHVRRHVVSYRAAGLGGGREGGLRGPVISLVPRISISLPLLPL